MITNEDLRITALGERLFPSRLGFSAVDSDTMPEYVTDDHRMRFQVEVNLRAGEVTDASFEVAGPRDHTYFDPGRSKVAIVTCGGLSPGLNNVIRSVVLDLYFKYQVAEIVGIRNGFKGLNPAHGYRPILLKPENVDGIEKYGGSILGSSRGNEDPKTMVDTLENLGISILLCVGGDGTLRGAHAIWEEIRRRGLKIAVVGVPKTIDNDINFVYKTFGFDTAVGKAREVLDCAHAEALGAPNGIGLVKVMGRDSGFIAAYATLASLEVNFCLIPEVPFDLYGDGAFLPLLEERLKRREHAVIVVAEGAGQDLIRSDTERRDASGNILHEDVGIFLKNKVSQYFEERRFHINLKYIDPSYIIRSVPADATDAIFCDNLSRHAAHAGVAGKTDLVIGYWHGVYVHVPLPLAVRTRKRVRLDGSLWRQVLEVTGQPVSMKAAS